MQINSTFDSVTGLASLPASPTPFYYLAWQTVTANGVTTQRCVGALYVPSCKAPIKTKNNILGFTTWAELTSYATANSIVGVFGKDPSPVA